MTIPILANIGLPTVALYLPPAWLALLPIILIEAGYGARRYQLPFRRAFLAQATANCLSTLIGIPLTWMVLVLIQFLTVPSGTGPAWLMPEPSAWSIAAAIGVLTVVFYLMSVATEGFVVARFFREVPRPAIRRWMVQANGITYTLLVAIIILAPLVPKVSRPMRELMQPVNESVVLTVYWIIDQVSGQQKKESPLIQAVLDGDLKKARKLIAGGANVDQTNEYGYSALYLAAQGDEKMTQLLLHSGADANARSSSTPLQGAAQRGNLATVRILLAAGARIEDTDGSGWTPLFSAALAGKLDVIEELLAAGANVNTRSSSGWTALKEAEMRGHQEVAERLKAAGAIDFPDGSR
jgi:hypothetical protein